MNKMPLIIEGDLLLIDDEVYKVFRCSQEQADNIDALYGCTNELIYHYEECPDTWYSYVNTVTDALEFDEITAIYRKQGKDYICIWETK